MKRTLSTTTLLLILLACSLSLAFRVQEVRASGTICIRPDGSTDLSTVPTSSVRVHVSASLMNSNETIPHFDWPMLGHDPSRSGYSESPAPKTNNTLWNCSLGGWVWSPAVADGMVFVGTYGPSNNVHALNATTGEVIWSSGGEFAVSSCPAVADGMVFITSDYRLVYAFNVTTGSQLWNYTTAGKYIESSPAVADGMVFFKTTYKSTDTIYALNEMTGRQIWNYTMGSYANNHCSPAVADGMVFIGSTDSILYAFNMTTGHKIWNYTASGYVHTPSISNDKVFVGSGNNLDCLDASTGISIWNYTLEETVSSGSAIADGIVFLGSGYGNVCAFNATTGDRIWNYTAGWMVYDTPAVADGMVFFGSWDHTVYALNATTGKKIWSYMTDGRLLSSPAVADGIIFIGSDDGNLYAFGDVCENEHDIAVNNIICSDTKVHEGDVVNINVIVGNEGTFSETFNTTAFLDSSPIAEAEVTLNPGMDTTLTFGWNSSGNLGIHEISAEASIVLGEIDTADNLFVDGVIEVITKIDVPIKGGENATVEANVTITQAVITKNTLHFTASGSSGSTGWINVTFPMVNTTSIKVFSKPSLDPAFPIITSNGTHYFIYFEFTLSTHEIMLIYADVDIALTGVDLWKAIVGENNPCKFNVTLSNQGDNEEVFNITLFGNGDIIGVIWNVTLSSGNTATITFEWDIASFLKGNYSISANITTVLLGELDITNNNLTGGWLLVTFPGDVDGDRDVDIFDIVKMALIYDVAKPDPSYDPNCDLDDDGDIDIFDIVEAAGNYGEIGEISPGI